jgi:hypothetical protein
MAQELVWARIGDHCAAVSRARAVAKGYEVLDESPRDANGDARRPTRSNGRPRKRRTSVKKEAAKKTPPAPAVEENAAASKAAEVIAEPASDNTNEENQR